MLSEDSMSNATLGGRRPGSGGGRGGRPVRTRKQLTELVEARSEGIHPFGDLRDRRDDSLLCLHQVGEPGVGSSLSGNQTGKLGVHRGEAFLKRSTSGLKGIDRLT